MSKGQYRICWQQDPKDAVLHKSDCELCRGHDLLESGLITLRGIGDMDAKVVEGKDAYGSCSKEYESMSAAIGAIKASGKHSNPCGCSLDEYMEYSRKM